jgi:hypothetical protein
MSKNTSANIDAPSRIRNCPWGYKCDKTWDTLIVTDKEDIRFCDNCDKAVYVCRTKQELADSVLLNRCVSFPAHLLYASNPQDKYSDYHIVSGEESNPTVEDMDLHTIGQVDEKYFSVEHEF